ncbi:unnamed protein product [Knipowitschia caucasica]
MLLALFLVLAQTCKAADTSNSSSTVFQYSIWEEQPMGTQVASLSDDLHKRDELGHLEGFQIVEHGKTLPFSVNAPDGVISTQGRLDREQLCRNSDVCELAFSVLYRKGGDVNCLRVHVEIMDLNDNSPSFPSPFQELEISEMAALRMRIPLEHAVDPDAGPNGLQTYSLSANTHFALDVTAAPGGTKQAELVVIKELDREVKDAFELTLVAWDKGNPPRSGSTMVRVKIQDSNDNSPIFEDSKPVLELPEDTEIGHVIANLKASDPDEGDNGLVEYSISKHTRPETKRLFAIDSQTGDVSLKALLDYEDTRSHEVIVQARDKGPNSIPSHCKLHVKVLDVNDNAPRIHATWTTPNSPGPNVLEGAEIGTFLALVLVSDADSGEDGDVVATLKEMSGPFQLEQMQRNNYKIVTNDLLDREQVSKYTITIIAQDRGNPQLRTTYHLPVHVLDLNDNAPVFSMPVYKAEISENNEQDYRALKVEAYDMDIELSGRVSYSIQNANEYPFSIHRTTGVITIHHSLDYETAKSYSFVVEAVDHGYPPLSSTATVEVEVLDVNDNYPIIVEPKSKRGIASVSVPVNAEKGEIMAELGNGEQIPTQHKAERFLALTVKATDLDEGINSELRYVLRKENNYDGLFSLDEPSGNLYVNTTNATELIGKTFKVHITVMDSGTPSLSTTTMLEITFINLKDHLKSSVDGNQNHFSSTMMIAICLGATCLFLLLAVALVTTFCRPVKRENRAYNCRHAESTYTRHPRRPQKNIRKSDIQLIPVIRGRKDDPLHDNSESQPLSTSSTMSEELPNERQYTLVPSCLNSSFHSQSYQEIDGIQASIHHGKTLCKPGNIELDSPLVITPASSYRTLRKSRNQSSSSSVSHASTLRRQRSEESNVSQATLRRQKTEGREAEQQRIWRNLVRLSMAAFGDSIELSAASPDVQQISQLLSLLRQGQLQPRTNFRGNKFSQRRYGTQDCGGDWQSTKDSGHGESEPGDGDMGWDGAAECPLEAQLEEGLSKLIHNNDEVFSDVPDPAWMARLSVPLSTDYHDNVFVPNGPPSTDSELLPPDRLDSSSSFSTFGKSVDRDEEPLNGALLSEVSSLFQMLMTQKGGSRLGPPPDVLYRLSNAYRQSKQQRAELHQ